MSVLQPSETESVLITAPLTAELRRLPIPGGGDGSVLVRVELCGICTPEQRVFRGTTPTYPYWGGHEISAVVLEDRSAVPARRLPAGTRVAVGLMPRCGRCEACRRGLDNHCAYIHRGEAAQAEIPGPRGLSGALLVESYKLLEFPPSVPPETVALTEPVACCLRSVRTGAPAPGDVVAVYGAGTMGRIHAALLADRGCRVLMFDDDEAARQAAERLPVAHVGPLDTTGVEAAVAEVSRGNGSAAAFCTRGGTRAIELAIRTSARKGVVVLYQSLPRDGILAVEVNVLHYREVGVVGTIAQSARDLHEARNLLIARPEFHRYIRHETLPANDPVAALQRALEPEVNRVFIDFRAL